MWLLYPSYSHCLYFISKLSGKAEDGMDHRDKIFLGPFDPRFRLSSRAVCVGLLSCCSGVDKSESLNHWLWKKRHLFRRWSFQSYANYWQICKPDC